MNEKLKKGDLVIVIGSDEPKLLGMPGEVIRVDYKGPMFDKDGEANNPDFTIVVDIPSSKDVWEGFDDTYWLFRSVDLLKITPPPTMVETEEEVTA